MYTLQRLNVVKIVSTEAKRDELISKGFSLIPAAENNIANLPEKPLGKMNLEELKALAAEKGIDVSNTDTKTVILEKIKEAEQEK
jgi:hypothetical protein